jgi:O-succinylbenzoic acid--CoA ligase
MKVPNPLAASARARPDHPALEADGRVWTYAELKERAALLASGLLASGAGPGCAVEIGGPRDADWVLTFHAVGWLGASAVPSPPSVVTPRPEPGAVPLPERDWPLDEVRLRIRTSGTTGEPREVPLTVGQLLLSSFGSMTRLGHHPADRWLACLPLHHMGGLSILLRCAWLGTTVVLAPRFEAAPACEAIERGGVSLVSLVPTQLRELLRSWGPRPFPPQLRALLVGGGPTPPELLEACRAVGAPVALTWGMTETGSQVATRWPGDLTPGPHAGPPLPFARVSSEAGRLVVEGPITPGGERLFTSDLGHLDALGRVQVTGRADDVMLRGGENLHPAPIEAALAAHPEVAECAIAGRPDPVWGESPVAWVVPKPGASPTPESLAAWCTGRLRRAEVPRAFQLVQALPRDELGKLARWRLKELP